MPLNYEVATANCGNDILGMKAVKTIAQHLTKKRLDFLLINAQEVHFDNALDQISDNLPRGYACELLGKMPTHTKLSEFQRNRTGLANIIIYKKSTVTIEEVSSMECRRNESSWTQGYNKGSLSSSLSLKSKDETLKIKTITGHLESYESSKRVTDWQKTYFNFHKKRFNSIKKLAEFIPHHLNIGMDANTRSLYTEGGKVIDIWQKGGYFEARALSKISFGTPLYSKPSTYKTNKPEIDKTPDKKRPGRVKGGSLDVVGIINASQPLEPNSRLALDKESATEIGLEPKSSKRDHHIILSSPQQLHSNQSKFKRCQNFIAQSLASFCPLTANTITSLEENEANKELLVKTYNSYLGTTKSLFGSYLECQQRKLDYLNSLEPDDAIEEQQKAEAQLDNIKKKLLNLGANKKTTLTQLFLIDSFRIKIEKLRYQFLSQAQCDCEKKHINTIIKQSFDEINAIDDFSELSDRLNIMSDAINCLLEVNADFYYYEKKISNNYSKQQRLIKIRSNLIDANLTADSKLSTVSRTITSPETLDVFSTHQDRLFLYDIFRWIKSFFDDNAKKTRGEKCLIKSRNTISHFFKENKQDCSEDPNNQKSIENLQKMMLD